MDIPRWLHHFLYRSSEGSCTGVGKHPNLPCVNTAWPTPTSTETKSYIIFLTKSSDQYRKIKQTNQQNFWLFLQWKQTDTSIQLTTQ